MNKITCFKKKKIISLVIAAVMIAALIAPLSVSSAVTGVSLAINPNTEVIAGETQLTISGTVTGNTDSDFKTIQVTISATQGSPIYTLPNPITDQSGNYSGTYTFHSNDRGEYKIKASATSIESSEITVTVLQRLGTPAIGTNGMAVNYATEILTWSSGDYKVDNNQISTGYNLSQGLDRGNVNIYAKGFPSAYTADSKNPLALSRPAKPVQGTDYTVSGNTITIKSSGLEYSAAETGTYTLVAQNSTLSLAGGSVYLRKAATSSAFRSLPTLVGSSSVGYAAIDYTRNEIYGLTPGGVYTINGVGGIVAGASGRVSINGVYLSSPYQQWDPNYGGYGYVYNIRITDINGNIQTLTYYTSQGYGYNHLSASNETGSGRNDGYIYGMQSAYTYEYKLSSESASAYRTLYWSSSNSGRSVNLVPGTYDVRINYYNNYVNYIQTLTIYPYGTSGWVTVSTPSFSSEYYGYSYSPSAKYLTIYNPSSQTVYINSISVSGYSFDIYGSASAISAGHSLMSYTIQPKANLSSGTYSETVTVTYRLGSSNTVYTASAQVDFTVLSNYYDYYDYSYYYGGSTVSSKSDVVDSTTRTVGTVGGVLSFYNKAEKNGDVNISVTTEAVTGAIDRMRSERLQYGKSSDSLDLSINFTTAGGYSPNAGIGLTSETLRELVRYGVNLTIVTDSASITFPSAAVRTINSSSSAGCVIKIFNENKPSNSVSALVGNRPLIAFKVYGVKGIKMNEISSFGAQLSVSINYTPGFNEKTENLSIYKIVGGKAIRMDKSSYSNGKITWNGNSLSLYAVGYKKPAPEFNDTIGHWARANIEFVVSRGMLTGTDTNVFSPNADMTRAMFITALGRLSGENVSSYRGEKHVSDVEDTSAYHPYIEWAYANKIITCDEEGNFEPSRPVTREEMAVMMYKYSAYANYKIISNTAAVSFRDSDKISAGAKEAVRAMQCAGIIQGKVGDILDPHGKATRAEASAVLQRFVVNVIDASPERGWVQESANGRWQYINGKGEAVKGWQEIKGSTYYFENNGYMAIGWKTLKGEKYYFDDNGVTAKSKWVKIGNDWYYFDADGVLAVDTTVDGYKVDSTGARK